MLGAAVGTGANASESAVLVETGETSGSAAVARVAVAMTGVSLLSVAVLADAADGVAGVADGRALSAAIKLAVSPELVAGADAIMVEPSLLLTVVISASVVPFRVSTVAVTKTVVGLVAVIVCEIVEVLSGPIAVASATMVTVTGSGSGVGGVGGGGGGG